jgi:hypothetical protein
MGLDVSLFGFSTQDYVLQSISTLYIPLLVIAVLVLGWLTLHQRILRRLARPDARPILLAVGRAALGLGALAAAAAVTVASLDRTAAPLVTPLSLLAGTALAAYGGWLVTATSEPAASAPNPAHRALRALLVGGLITLALFWEVSNYAAVVGRGYALQLATAVPQLPHATALSEAPLEIRAPGVRQERVAVGTGTYRYRTTGLRFLTRSGGRMFLLHDGWTPQRGTVIVLPDTDQVGWQFSR